LLQRGWRGATAMPFVHHYVDVAVGNAFVNLVNAHCGSACVPFCSQWRYVVHYTPLVADHWCKTASRATRTPTCLTQGDCDEMLVIRPDQA